MKIIGSKVRDYYDGLINQHGYDQSGNIFFRDPEVVISTALSNNLKFLVQDYKLRAYSRRSTDNSVYQITFFKVLVTGKLYGGVKVTFLSKIQDYTSGLQEDHLFFYSFDLFDSFMEMHKIKFDKPKKRYFDSGLVVSDTRKHFDIIDILDKCIDNKLVIVTICPHGQYSYSIEFNGELKKFEFYKVLDTFSIWQELEFYVDGRLTSPGNKMVEIEDKYKIEGHGFDSKYGFRTRKIND